MNELIESFFSDLKVLDVYHSDSLILFRVASRVPETPAQRVGNGHIAYTACTTGPCKTSP